MPLSPRLRALARAGVFGIGALLASTAGAQVPAPRSTPPGSPRRLPPAPATPAVDTSDAAGAPSSSVAESALPRLALADALRAALARNPALRIAREQVRAGRGAVIAAEAPFDPYLVTTLANSRTSDLAFAPAAAADALAAAPIIATHQRVLDYHVGIEKQFRYGVTLAPTVDVQQVGIVGHAGGPANRASAGLTLVAPLGRNRLGGAVDAERQVAAAGFDAAVADLRQITAQTAFDVATAYWQYAAAGEQLAAYTASEARAGVLVDETAELVRADARPAADLRQFRGNLATKRAQRIAAEQVVAEARQQLGTVLGLPADAIAGLRPARLAVPGSATAGVGALGNGAVDEKGFGGGVLGDMTLRDGSGAAERRLATWATAAASAALAQRPDVRAAAARREAAEYHLAAAGHALRPRADLTVGVSYAGLTRGAGVDGLFSPLSRAMPGASTVVQLQYDLPARHLLARGQAEQADAALEQARVAERELARRIESAVAVAATGVERGRRALAEAGEAVRIAGEVVENEQQKFKLGVSTQIDVLYAEDALTSAVLAEVGARRGYAASVGALRLHTGDLAAAGVDPVALARVLAGVPPSEARQGATPNAPPRALPNEEPATPRRTP